MRLSVRARPGGSTTDSYSIFITNILFQQGYKAASEQLANAPSNAEPQLKAVRSKSSVGRGSCQSCSRRAAGTSPDGEPCRCATGRNLRILALAIASRLMRVMVDLTCYEPWLAILIQYAQRT